MGVFRIFHAICDCPGWISVLLLAACAHTPLNTGKFITPQVDNTTTVGNMPMSLAISQDGQYFLCSDMGYHEALWSIRIADGQGVSHLDFDYHARGKKRAPATPTGESEAEPTKEGSAKSIGLYYGLAVGPAGLPNTGLPAGAPFVAAIGALLVFAGAAGRRLVAMRRNP